ncbi:MAG: ribose 5-phosphate isomerase A [Candidatus Zixiibacteriota bacterium]|nr:MAG: ribose 5-phosphate isomerase A [candidate division Zixibacteria bacterium]
MIKEFSNTEILNFRHLAAERAVDFVNSGMIVGLGSGPTAKIVIETIGKRIITGILSDIIGIPTSKESEREALRNGLMLSTLNDNPRIDLTIDGADEVDLDLNLIKGGRGALFREKIIADSSAEVIIVVDETKLSHSLGKLCPVPVEVYPMAIRSAGEFVRELGAMVTLREDKEGKVFKTEQGNNILDCRFGPIENPHELAQKLSMKPGIIEYGLFLNMANIIIVGGKEGIRHLKR